MIFDEEKAARAQPQPLKLSGNAHGYRQVNLSTWKQGELLGRGASGEVYKAMCAGHFFAVKKVNLGTLSQAAGEEKKRVSASSMSVWS